MANRIRFVGIDKEKSDCEARPGLYIEDKWVSDYIVTAEGIINEFCQGKVTKKYVIHLQKIEWDDEEKKYLLNDYGTQELESIDNIDYYEMFGCPDALVESTERLYHKQKIQEDTRNCKVLNRFFNMNGLVKINDTKYFLLAGNVISEKESDTTNIRIMSDNSLVDSNMVDGTFDRESEIKQVSKYINFIPGVTEILFYSALSAPVKEIMLKMGVHQRGFATMLVGPPGHLKTALAERYAIWTENVSMQKEFFQNVKRKSELLNQIKSYAGMNFVMDDLHSMSGNYERNRQKDRLDDIIRCATSDESCANVIITGESLLDMGISSCIDRIIQIKIPQMTSDQLNEKKSRMGELHRYFLAGTAKRFIAALMENYNQVEKDINGYLELHNGERVFGSCGNFRIGSHAVIICLTEQLFRKYCCAGVEQISGKIELENALKNLIAEQERDLKRLNAQNKSYIMEVVQLIKAINDKRNFYVVDERVYDYKKPCCLFKEKNIFITKENLRIAFRQYLNIDIDNEMIDKLVSDMKKAGLIETYKNGSLKKCRNKRHVVINTLELERFAKDDENMTVSVIRG